MKKRSKPDRLKGFRKSMVIQSTIVVITSVMMFEWVEYFFYEVLNTNRPVYDPILGIGMIVPMGAIMWLISYSSLRTTNRYISKLIDGITRVSDGDFTVRLDVRKAGPMKQVFANFNKMSADLDSVETLREDFINHFSHEFKTPISAINGFALLLQEGGVSEADRQKYLGIIASESARLADLSNNTLLLSKLETMQRVAEVRPYSLDEQIKECVILLSGHWTKKNIDISADLKPVTFSGNAELTKQVWINILGNAIKFTPEGGKIFVALETDGQRIETSVRDTGIGMTPEEAALAFNKYFQGDPDHPARGLGLGLSIAKRIVDLCGGTIEIRSALNRGCTVSVSLPAEIAKKNA